MLLRLVREDITDASVSVIATLSGNPVTGEKGTYDDYMLGCQYRVRYPKLEVDDGEIVGYQDVGESCTVSIAGTVANMVATIEAINRLAADITEWGTRQRRYRVWLEYRPDSSMIIYRSRLLSLAAQWPDVPITGMVSGQSIEEFGIQWMRRWYWEDPYAADPVTNSGTYVLTEIPLKKSTTSYATGGVSIENHDDSDAGDDNWVQMRASDLKGSVPFAPILRVRNLEVTSMYDVYAAHRAFIDETEAGTFTQILEGEDASAGTPRVSASASGGNYQELTGWGGTTVSPDWTLVTADLEAAAGHYYRILAFFYDDGNNAHDPSVSYEARLALRPGGGAVISQTGWTRFVDDSGDTLDQFIQELGTIQIPPYLQENISDMYDLELVITFRNTVDGTPWLNLDFIQLTPMPDFRHLLTTSFRVDQNVDIYDDHMRLEEAQANAAYSVWPQKLGNYVGYGEPFRIDPAKAHRLYFLHTPATINHSVRIQAYYYPRYLWPTD